MADDTNEDSWLYGTSNPDSTTNEISNGSDALAAEHEALAAVTGEKPGAGALPAFPKEELLEYAEFEDPAKEMEEDEEALPDTTEGNARAPSGTDAGGSGLDDAGSQGEDAEMADLTEGAPATMGRKERNGSGSDDDDDDDSDDDINVVIGDIKSAPSTYNIKQRPNLLAGATGADKAKPTAQAGKFSIEDFEGAGTINGVAVHEFSIDSLEEKPWRKPGADITDYFNYGFNEETWRAYCERQKRFRVAESGVGLASLTQNINQSATSMGLPDGGSSNMGGPMGMGGPMHHHQPMVVLSEGPMQMPPPGMPPMMQHQPRPGMGMMARPPRPISTGGGVKENAIQVMTAECREYSRGGLGPMAPNFPPPGAADEPFFHEPEPFDYGYEPTQESQWGNDNAGWVPTGIKELTPGPAQHLSQQQQGPPQMGGPPGMPPPMNVPPPQMGGPPPQLRGQHAPPGMMPPNMRMPHNMGMGPPPGMMRMPHNMNMGPQQRMPMGGNNANSSNSNMAPSASSDRRSDGYDDDRERRRREKDKQLKKEQLRKDFLDMLRERQDIERHTRWYDIKKKFESDPRYRALDSAYREEYFEDYLHILKEEKRKERDHKERDRERSARDKERSRDKDKDKDKEKEKEKDKEKDKDKDKDKESSRREDRSRSNDKSSRRKSKSREKERSERSSKQSSSSSSSSRSEKKKSHRKDKEEEE